MDWKSAAGGKGEAAGVISCPTDFHRYNRKKGLYATIIGWRIDPFGSIKDVEGWRHAV